MRALILLLLLFPCAVASGSQGPVEGEVRFESPAILDGVVQFSTWKGALLLADLPALPDAALESLVDRAPSRAMALATEISWRSASGWIVTRERHGTGVPPLAVGEEPVVRNVTQRFSAGAIRDVVCHAPCVALLYAEDESSFVGLEGRMTDAVAWTTAERVMWSGDAAEGARDAFRYVIPEGAIGASAATDASEGSRLEDARPRVGGRVGLLMWNVTLTLAADGVERHIDLRETREQRRDAFGLPLDPYVRTRFLMLSLEDAQARGRTEHASVYADVASVSVAGALAASRASGRIDLDGQARSFEQEAIAVSGTFQLLLSTEPGRTKLLVANMPVGPSHARAKLGGDADWAQVGASPMESRVALVAGITGVGLAALFLLALQRGLFGMFTRIEHASVLAAPRRRLLYESVRAWPGSRPADLVRLCGVPRAVVEHHLRVLESHGYLAQRAEGRMRRYYLRDEAPAGGVAPDILRDETRRLIHDRILLAGAVTQRELAALTGISRRLVSYHVRRLVSAGLVREEGSFPRRYATVAPSPGQRSVPSAPEAASP